MKDYREEVSKGYNFLIGFGYKHKAIKDVVNSDNFDMEQTCECVLGGLHGSYIDFVGDNMSLCDNEFLVTFGFDLQEPEIDYTPLTEAWKEYVNASDSGL